MSAKEILESKYKGWSTKTGIPVAMLAQKAADEFEAGVLKWPELDEEARWGRVANIIGSQMTSEMRSDAKLSNLYFFSCGERRNLSADDYAEKKQAYMDDPDKAIGEGLVNNQGVPIDTRPTYPNTEIKNRGYGKPLQPFWQKVAFGLYKGIKKGDAMKFLTLRFRGKMSLLKVPLKTPFMGRINLRTETQYHMNATSSSSTRLAPGDFPEIEGLSVIGMLQAVNEELKSDPVGLADWMDINPDASFVVVEGDIVGPVGETSTGNLRFFLGEAMNEDFGGINCFAPYDAELAALGVGSRIAALGYPSEGEDLEGNPQITLNVNVVGVVYAVEAAADLFDEDDSGFDVE